MRTAVLFLAALAFFVQAAHHVQAQIPANAAVLTIQFDNSKRSVVNPSNNNKILNALAKYVFYVPVSQVKLVSGIDQSGVLTRQATVVYRAVGPTTNGKTVLANCQAATRGHFFGLLSSPLEKEIKSATDTWWPGDSIDVQKAECAAGRRL